MMYIGVRVNTLQSKREYTAIIAPTSRASAGWCRTTMKECSEASAILAHR
jgi:hypothetical protein